MKTLTDAVASAILADVEPGFQPGGKDGVNGRFGPTHRFSVHRRWEPVPITSGWRFIAPAAKPPVCWAFSEFNRGRPGGMARAKEWVVRAAS